MEVVFREPPFQGKLELPDGSRVDVLKPSFADKPLEKGGILASAMEPVKGPTLEEFVEANERILLILNDGQRPTPTGDVLSELKPLLAKAGELSALVACGTHREPTPEEMTRILGPMKAKLSKSLRLNDARGGQFRRRGMTQRGTPVEFNVLLDEFDGAVCIGSVEPHYFAGLTGGRKSFLPGISSYASIERNHSLALDPASRSLALSGNPVHEDMAEAARMLDLDQIFSIQTVVDSQKRVCFASCGDLFASFKPAVDMAVRNYGVPIKKRYDLVIAGVPSPFGNTLYQAQKGLENASLARKKGGRIVWAAGCGDGVGNDAFIQLLRRGKTPEGALDLIAGEFKLGYQKAARIARHAIDGEIFLLSGLPEKNARDVFATPIERIGQASKGYDEPVRVAVMPDAAMTVPRMAD